jgi:predicted nicotinamide N-methyase
VGGSAPAGEPHGRALAAELRRRFVTTDDRIVVGTVDLAILRPRNPDELISEEDFARDERLPYWADIWPSSLLLAEHIQEGGIPAGRVLELGCGLGLVTMAAMRAGCEVLATDYYDDALRFTRVNAWRNLGREPATRLVDWRALPDDLGVFDHIVAADVLYERPHAALVAEAVARALRPGGTALIADPGRIAVESFLEECAARGIALVGREERPFVSGTIRQRITIHRLTKGA